MFINVSNNYITTIIKAIIGFGFRMASRIIQTSVNVTASGSLRQIKLWPRSE